MATATKKKAERLSLRASDPDKRLIARAARKRKTTMTNYILESALVRAEQDMMDESVFQISDENWNAFVAAVDRPPRVNPALQKLFRKKSVFSQKVGA